MAENNVATTLSSDDLNNLKGLVPGSSVDLQITTPTSPKRVKTQYIGMDVPNGLIFQVPNSPKWTFIRDLLTPDNAIVVRYVLEGEAGQVIAFRVKVQRLITRPFGMLVTTFPSRIQSLGLRSEKRSQLGINVKVFAADETKQQEGNGVIVDVSNRGCRVALPATPPWPALEMDAGIAVRYEEGGRPVIVQGKIKNRTQEKDYVYYGVRFEDNQPAVQKLFERHILTS